MNFNVTSVANLSLTDELIPRNIRYGIFYHGKNAYFPPSEDESTELIQVPDIVPSPDKPEGEGSVGHTIPVLEPWWLYFEKVLDEQGMGFAMSVDIMWINRGYNWLINPPAYPPAECINSGGCFGMYDEVRGNYYHQLSYANDLDAVRVLNPERDNWMYYPGMWMKGGSIDRYGRLFKIANGRDVYLPTLRRTDRWIWHEDFEPFKDVPFEITHKGAIRTVIRYRLLGCSVIGILEDGTAVWLRKATKPGEQIQPYPEWQLRTSSVIPQSDWHVGTSTWVKGIGEKWTSSIQ